MKYTVNTLRGLILTALATTTLAGAASAQQLAATTIANGDCKSNFVVAMAGSPAAAQAMWAQNAASAYGNKWAIWAGARNKQVIPQEQSGTTVFRAQAQPCFYQPVP